MPGMLFIPLEQLILFARTEWLNLNALSCTVQIYVSPYLVVDFTKYIL